MAVYIAKNAYFNTIKGMKINRVFPVGLELRNLIAIVYGLRVGLVQEKKNKVES